MQRTPIIPPALEAGLEAVNYYDPPNLTFPFGTYICVVDIDKGTGEIKVRRFVAVDDCGNIINPMIVEGQIHGGLTEGLAIAFMQLIDYDENGNVARRQLYGLSDPDGGGDAALGNRARPARRHRIIRLARKAWANHRTWARRRHL